MSENKASDNKVAMATGAGQGIGRGIALKLASDGFDIAVMDLPFQEEKAAGVVAEIEALGAATSSTARSQGSCSRGSRL